MAAGLRQVDMMQQCAMLPRHQKRFRTLLRHLSARPTASNWRDPHSISSELDAKTTEAIITRLESRGKDPIFRGLFDTYFPYVLRNCNKVLEIGAGTGVICRSLAASGYSGIIVGTDQSKAFVDAANNFAAQEGCNGDKVSFTVADARSLRADVATDDFDCLVMHTLISHVDDPLFVLKAAREVVRPGAVLIIVDGDYTGLSYHSSTNPELSRNVSKALVTATFASPGVVRDLPTLLTESGWVVESVSGQCVSEIGTAFSYWKTFAEAYMPRVIGSGLVEEADVKEWWAEQLASVQAGRFFAACTYYTIIAKAV